MKGVRLISVLKPCVFIALATMACSVFAHGYTYVGNPTRPDTIWIPGHCQGGCWSEGYYMKFIDQPVCAKDVMWVDGQYDRNGNWIPAHYQPTSYRVVGIVR